MGLMDKAKEAALKGKAQAQQIAQQGQAKVAELKETREEGELMKALGEAYYAEQRKGGGHDAVAVALAAVDAHFAEAAQSSPPPPAGPGGETPPAASGDYTLNDV